MHLILPTLVRLEQVLVNIVNSSTMLHKHDINNQQLCLNGLFVTADFAIEDQEAISD